MEEWAQDKYFLFLFVILDTVLQNSTPEEIASIWQIKRIGITAMKFETARILCFGDIFVAVTFYVA